MVEETRADATADPTAAPVRFPAVLGEWRLWVLMLVVVVLLAPVLFGDSTLFFRDLYRQYVGTARLLDAAVGGPLWDPLMHGGQPLLANPNRAILYPSRLLYLVMGPVAGLNWEIALHLLLAAAAGYLTARVMGLSGMAATVVGAVFCLAGVPLSLTNHQLRLLSYPWIGFALLAGSGLTTSPAKPVWLVVLAGCTLLQGLSGSVEAMIVTVVLVTGWQLAGAGGVGSRIRRAAGVFGCCLIGVAAAGIQVVPSAAMVARSMRPLTAGAESVLAWSVHPVRLLEFLYPGILGPVGTAVPAADYWGSRFVDFGFPYFLSLYVGLPALLLLVGGIVWGAETPVSRRHRLFLAGAVGLSVAASLGRHIPGVAVLMDHLGPLAVVRFPVKALLLASLPIALLAGVGAEGVITGDRRVRRTVLLSGIGVSGISLLLWSLTKYRGLDGSSWLSTVFDHAGETAAGGVAGASMHALIVGGLITLVVALGKRIGPVVRGSFVAGVLIVDLVVAGNPVLLRAPRSLLAGEPPLVSEIAVRLDGGRFFRDADPAMVHPRLERNHAAAGAAWWISVLDESLGAVYGLPMVYHGDEPLVSDRRMVSLTERIKRLPWARRLPVLAAAGATVVMTPRDPGVVELEHVATVGTQSDVEYRLYSNRRALTRAWFVDRSMTAATAAETLDLVCSDRFDPWREVVLETRTPVEGRGWMPAALMVAGEAEEFEIGAPTEGFLVFSEVWNPGWRIEVDGAEAPLLRANYAFSAVAVQEGRHLIRRIYRPVDVTLGLWLTIAALGVLVVVAWRTRTTG